MEETWPLAEAVLLAKKFTLAEPAHGMILVDGKGQLVGMVAWPDAGVALVEGKSREPVGRLARPVSWVRLGDEVDAVTSFSAETVVVDGARRPVGWLSLSLFHEAGLKRATERLEELMVGLNSAYNAILVVDREARVVATNTAMEKILGCTLAEAWGRSIREFIPHTGMGEVLQTGEPRIGSQIAINGRTYLSNRTPVYRDGLLVGAVAVLQDITALENALAERDEANRLKNILASVLDNAYEGIVVVDEQGIVTMFNQAYSDFLGVPAEEVIGHRVQEVIENTRMHIVVQTGQAEIRQVQRIKGHDMVCDRIPIKKGDRVVAAVGKVLFRDVSELDAMLQQTRRLQSELEYYKEELKRHQGTRYSLENIIGDGQTMLTLKELAQRVAWSNSTIFLRGESGTGKELFAHAIHNASSRVSGPFINVNCAALPENLLESELFGYQEGAFTGARKGGKVGKFELANGGTIFLDEIAEMPTNMQAKLLRALQEKEIERLGGTRPLKIDVRVIAATHRNLEEMVAAGQFREDLFYRLNVITLDIPPLRERREDIPALVAHLVEKLARNLGFGKKKVDPSTMQILKTHRWPGNVRELENVLERALNLVEGDVILPSHLPYYLQRGSADADALPSLKEALWAAEADIMRQALKATGGNALKAARLLQVSKSTFYEKAGKYRLLLDLR